jgi:hypothetical protein
MERKAEEDADTGARGTEQLGLVFSFDLIELVVLEQF